MVNNYPEYAAGVNFKKTDSNDVTHFYSAQVVADPSDETIESKLIKDGVVISEGGGSSDFSTAEVTFDISEDNEIKLSLPIVYNVEPEEAIVSVEQPFDADSEPVMVVLYKNRVGVDCGYELDVTGDATLNDGLLIITGDCTLSYGPK